MGKRKPTVPRRRVGTNFADLTVHRTAYIDTRRSSDGGAGVSVVADPNGAPWPRAQVPVDSYTGAVGASPPLPSETTVASGAASMSHSHSSQMPLHTDPAAAATHHVGKPTVPTVPSRQEEIGAHEHQSPPRASEETVTMTVADLESWKQRMIMQIEDHFTNEQLKRIAEFGRVHANLVKEAKEYVAGIEAQLKEQFERERESLTRQAEAYVAQFQQENDQLRQRVQALEEELEALQQDDEQEEEEEEMEATAAEATMETLDSGSPIPDTALNSMPASGGDSTDDSSMASYSPDLLVEKQTANSIRVDAVAETMQRAMGIQTTSPTEVVMRRSTSPSTTHEGSPIDANDGPRRTPTPKNSPSGNPTPEATGTEYL